MKILLTNPLYRFPAGRRHEKYFIRSGSRWPHSGIKRTGTLPHYLPFPFALGAAAAWLRDSGFAVQVLDCVAADASLERLEELVRQEAFDVIFLETTTPTIGHDLACAARLKAVRPEARIVLGGPHSSVFPREILAANPAIAVILRHEYEEILLNLVTTLAADGDLAGVRGIVYRAGGEIRETAAAAPIEPLDRLPEPAYDLFPAPWRSDPTVYWDGFCQHRPALQMTSSRGCPYRCDFCLWNQVMYRNGKYRTYSALRVVDAMERVVQRYGVREIYFDDDDFTVSARHVTAICEEIRRRNLSVAWSCMGDAINLTADLVRLMAASGCVGIKVGVETGSPRMLRRLGKPLNLANIQHVVSWCAAARVKLHATFALGLEGDDRQSVDETLAFMETLEADTIQVSFCTPFPGTRFFDHAARDGNIRTTDWERYDGKASEVVAYPGLDFEQVDALRRRALRRWLFGRLRSPFWLGKQLRYGLRTLRGLGPRYFFRQVIALLTDEYLTARGGGSPAP